MRFFLQVKSTLKEDFIDLDVTVGDELVTADGLEQSYFITPTEEKFLLLASIIKCCQNKKAMVFFNCCQSVKYYKHLLNACSLKVSAICVSIFIILIQKQYFL